jgi:hypothetical protein
VGRNRRYCNLPGGTDRCEQLKGLT